MSYRVYALKKPCERAQLEIIIHKRCDIRTQLPQTNTQQTDTKGTSPELQVFNKVKVSPHNSMPHYQKLVIHREN